MKRGLHAVLFWLWTGFVGGGLILLYVAVPFEAFLRSAEVARVDIDFILTLLAGIWIVSSGILAYIAASALRNSRAAWLVHAVGIVLAAVTFHQFVEAGAGRLAEFRAHREVIGERFVFGPYPGESEMKRLAEEKYSGVVTLLSPVVPFEAVLLREERENGRKYGVPLIEASMLPWISENEASLASLRDLVRDDHGRYYVHCYLGRHRVDLARYTILDELGIQSPAPRIVFPDRLERGPVTRVSDTIAIGPRPTTEEWFEFVVRSGTRRVISMLDPANPDDRKWIDRDRRHAETSGIELFVIPVRTPADIGAVLREIYSSEERVYAHGFHADERVKWLRERLVEVQDW